MFHVKGRMFSTNSFLFLIFLKKEFVEMVFSEEYNEMSKGDWDLWSEKKNNFLYRKANIFLNYCHLNGS